MDWMEDPGMKSLGNHSDLDLILENKNMYLFKVYLIFVQILKQFSYTVSQKQSILVPKFCHCLHFHASQHWMSALGALWEFLHLISKPVQTKTMTSYQVPLI